MGMKRGNEEIEVPSYTIPPQAGSMRVYHSPEDEELLGEVREASDEHLHPMPGYSLSHPVRWRERSDLTELVGLPLHIELSIREAELYAFELS